MLIWARTEANSEQNGPFLTWKQGSSYHEDTKIHSAASRFALRRNQRIAARLLRIRRVVFRLRLSFGRLIFLRRRRKADYGEKQKPSSSHFEKELHNILKTNRLQLAVLKNTHKEQEVERL